jgi:signal transduction histidine kinase
LRLSGFSFEVAMVPGVLVVSAAYFRLGIRFMRERRPDGTGTAWIGAPLIALSVLPLLYPLLVTTSVSWLGYLLATSLHLSVGFGMIVHVLERHTEAVRLRHEELDLLRDDFVASVSHELRTPVTAVKAAARMLAAGLLGPTTVEQRDYIGIIARNSDRLHSLIDDLLDLAEAQAGALRFAPAPTDVTKLVDEVVAGIRPLAAQSGITLLSHVEPALFVHTDGSRLAQVLLNLLSNAVKFTPRGGEVVVDASSRERDVFFRVRDTGPGISAADQSRLFSKFFRAGRVNTRPGSGTGLGLALAKRIVEDGLKGTIWVESKVGEGSSFCVSIPAAPADRAPLANGGD